MMSGDTVHGETDAQVGLYMKRGRWTPHSETTSSRGKLAPGGLNQGPYDFTRPEYSVLARARTASVVSILSILWSV